MKPVLLICLTLAVWSIPTQARDVQAELQSIQKQKQLVRKAQQALNKQLGEVGKKLKILDEKLLAARHAYRKVRQDIAKTNQRLQTLAEQKQNIKKSMQRLFQQMLREAKAAYKHRQNQSVWVDMLSDTSITEIPHRQYLLKKAMLAQEKDRQAWQEKMHVLNGIEQEERAKKAELLRLEHERKKAEQILVSKITDKQQAAKALRSSLQQKKEQERRLAQQEKALKRLLDGLADTLLASDKNLKATSIRKHKGKLDWPLKGHVVVGFGDKTHTGVRLSGVHIAPAKRSEQGKLVRAMSQGQVRYADWFGGYGLMMIVDYGHGIMAVYAHNDALHKQLGDWVEKGEVLAEAGSTGWIDDVRLYFEVRDKGKPVNPARWCKK